MELYLIVTHHFLSYNIIKRTTGPCVPRNITTFASIQLKSRKIQDGLKYWVISIEEVKSQQLYAVPSPAVPNKRTRPKIFLFQTFIMKIILSYKHTFTN